MLFVSTIVLRSSKCEEWLKIPDKKKLPVINAARIVTISGADGGLSPNLIDNFMDLKPA